MADQAKAPDEEQKVKADDKALAAALKQAADAEAYAAELEKDSKEAAAKAAKEIADLKAKLKDKGAASVDAARAPKLVRMVVTTGATIADGRVRTEGYEFDVDEKDVAELVPQGFAVLKR